MLSPQESHLPEILVVEDTDSLREVLVAVLEGEGFRAIGVPAAEQALPLVKESEFSLILSDLKLPGISGIDFLKASKQLRNKVPLVVMTAYGTIDVAVEAMKQGALDFITKPFDPSMLVRLVHQVVEHRRIVDREGAGRRRARQLLTQCPAMEDLLRQAERVASLSSPVLILGESGSGKELVARYIHSQGPRSEQPFVGVNCASMPGELLESEFFGHEAGAFTGATEERPGLFEVAGDGTIFLDEIGNMPLALQVKLLRTLQESEIRRLGSTKSQRINARVISATNANLAKQIYAGVFREDLFYRLGVVVLDIPPLRERREDISLLSNYFLKLFALELNKPQQTLMPEGLKLLENYSWPGNVRELENVLERAVIFNDGPLGPEELELPRSQLLSDTLGHSMNSDILPPNLLEISSNAAKKAEVECLLRVLGETGGNKSKAAKLLGISYKTLLNKVKEYSL